MKTYFSTNGTWNVEENGNLVYREENKVFFSIEQGCLANPNLFFDLSLQPNFNLSDFAPKYLLAAQKAQIEILKIKLNEID